MKTLILLTLLSLVITGIAHMFALDESKKSAFGKACSNIWTVICVCGIFSTIVFGTATVGVGITSVPHEVNKMNRAIQADIAENGIVFSNPFGEDVAVDINFADQLKELNSMATY